MIIQIIFPIESTPETPPTSQQWDIERLTRQTISLITFSKQGKVKVEIYFNNMFSEANEGKVALKFWNNKYKFSKKIRQ